MFLQNFGPLLKNSAAADGKEQPYEVMHIKKKVKDNNTRKCEAKMHY